MLGPLLELGKELELLCSFSPDPTRLGISPTVLLTPLCPFLFKCSFPFYFLSLISLSFFLQSCDLVLNISVLFKIHWEREESTSLKASWPLLVSFALFLVAFSFFGQLGYFLPMLSEMPQEDHANESVQEKVHTAEVHGCYCRHTRTPTSTLSLPVCGLVTFLSILSFLIYKKIFLLPTSWAPWRVILAKSR